MDWGNKREERMGCSQPCCPSVVSEFRDPMDCSLPGSSVHGILQVRILEWVAISFSRGSSWLKDGTCTSCFGSWILYHPATRESPIFSLGSSKVKRLQGGQLLRVSAVHGVAAPDLFCRSPPLPRHRLPYCLPILATVPTTGSESPAAEDGSLCFRAGREGKKRDNPFLLLPLSTWTTLSDKLSVSLGGIFFTLEGLRYCSWGRWREEGFEKGMASGAIRWRWCWGRGSTQGFGSGWGAQLVL